MYFIDPSERKRYQVIDEQLSVTHDLLHEVNVSERVDPDFVADFGQFVETYYVPNIKHGQVIVTDQQMARSGHPVIALSPDETVRFDPQLTTFREDQKEKIVAKLEQWQFIGGSAATKVEQLEHTRLDAMKHNNDKFSLKSVGAAARVQAHRYVIPSSAFADEIDEDAVLNARPITILGLPTIADISIKPSIAAHEIKHVQQFCETPAFRAVDNEHANSHVILNSEEQAYQINIAINEGLADAGYPASLSSRVDRLAHQTIKTILNDPDDPTVDHMIAFNAGMREGIKKLNRGWWLPKL